MKRFFTVLICLVLAAFLASCKIVINKPAETGEVTEAATQYAHERMELADLDKEIAKTEHQSIPVSTLRYFMMDQYSSFLNNYYYYLSYFGLDPNVPLHDQIYDKENGTTWYEYFLSLGKKALEQYAKFAEMAIKENIALDQTDIAGIDEYLENIESAAKENNVTFEEYMSEYMGEGMTRERIRAAVELSRLGYKYYLKIYDGINVTEDQIEAEFNEKIKEYGLVDYLEAYVKAEYDETNTDEEVEAAKAAAADKAAAFKALVEGGKSFVEAYNETFPASEGEEPAAEADLLVKGAANGGSLDKLAFIFEDGAKQGDINLYTDENGNVYIVQCSALPYKNMQKSVDVRHILLDSSAYSTEEAAEEKAKELVEEIKAASDPKAKFIELVAQHSTDPGSNATGGLYENVCPGDMVTEFNDWCFDADRKVGDVGYVLTNYGFHIMYFEGFGEEIWHTDCESAIRDTAFEKLADDIYASVELTYSEDLTDAITR